MSFSLVLTGSPAAVSRKCDEISDFESDHSVATKQFVKALMKDAPADTVVHVEASGSHSYAHKDTPRSKAYHSYGTVQFKFSLLVPLEEPAQDA
jgi:hypothetical protein